MSADNYMAVKQKDDKWYVWMVLGGYEESDWEVKEPFDDSGYYRGEFTDKLAALEYAHGVCNREVVEYGVVLIAND